MRGFSSVSSAHLLVRGSFLLPFIFLIHYNWSGWPSFGWICCSGSDRTTTSCTGTTSTSSRCGTTSCSWYQLVQCRFTPPSNLKWRCYQTWRNLLSRHLNISSRERLEFVVFTLEKKSIEEWTFVHTLHFISNCLTKITHYTRFELSQWYICMNGIYVWRTNGSMEYIVVVKSTWRISIFPTIGWRQKNYYKFSMQRLQWRIF